MYNFSGYENKMKAYPAPTFAPNCAVETAKTEKRNTGIKKSEDASLLRYLRKLRAEIRG